MKKMMKIRVNGKRDKIESCNLIDAFWSFQQRDQNTPKYQIIIKKKGENVNKYLKGNDLGIIFRNILQENDKTINFLTSFYILMKVVP